MKNSKSIKKAEELNNSLNGILAIAENYPELIKIKNYIKVR